jgi:hypothetical protein
MQRVELERARLVRFGRGEQQEYQLRQIRWRLDGARIMDYGLEEELMTAT